MTGEPTDDDLLAEAVDWRMRVEAAPADATLRAQLDAWLARSDSRRRAYTDVAHMVQVASALPAGYDASAAAGYAPARRRPLFTGRTAYAAIALAACLAFVFLPTLQLWLASDYRTGTAELRTVSLDDGSMLWLDAGSAVAIRYAGDRREVALLSGRAFFDVVPASKRPFVVSAGGVTVTVTGTSFDVASSDESVAVVVRSGTVTVAGAQLGSQPTTLTRGERVEIERKSGRAARSEIAPEDVAAWREHRLVADGATLGAVVEELGRHYPGVIVFADRAASQRVVSGIFDLRRPLEALQAAVRTHGGSVTRITPYLTVISGGA